MNKNLILLIVVLSVPVLSQNPAGSIESTIGTTEINPIRKAGWKPARPAMKIFSKDQIRTELESFAEIKWSSGGVLRLAEKSLMVIEEPPLPGTPPSAAKVLQGRVWANMKAITSTGKKFDLASPCAVAGIRGTIFRVDVGADSATDVSVYEGKVAVGPASFLANGMEKTADTANRHEIEGPQEVEGPHEVTLEKWVEIVAGQRIRVETTGAFKTWDFDKKQDSLDTWVKYNREKDQALQK
jgi:hypothetical protein